MSFRESSTQTPHERRWPPRINYYQQGIRYQRDATFDYAQHDEADEYDVADAFGLGYDIEQQNLEAFGLEPQYIEVSSTVDGDWTVVERDVVRTIMGVLF